MNLGDTAFRDLSRDFVNEILIRKPPAVTDAEKLFLDFLVKANEDGHFEQTG